MPSPPNPISPLRLARLATGRRLEDVHTETAIDPGRLSRWERGERIPPVHAGTLGQLYFVGRCTEVVGAPVPPLYGSASTRPTSTEKYRPPASPPPPTKPLRKPT